MFELLSFLFEIKRYTHDFRGFVATISHRYFVFDDPPPPPYDAPPPPTDPFSILPAPPVDEVSYIPEPFVPDKAVAFEPIVLNSAVPESGILQTRTPYMDFDPFHYLTLIPFPSADLPPWEPAPATSPFSLPPLEIIPPIPSPMPCTEYVPFDPYPRVTPLPEPGTLEFQHYMHPILYPPSRDAQEGPSHPFPIDSDDEDPDEETPEMIVEHGQTRPLRRRTTADGVDVWEPIPEPHVCYPMVDTDVEDETEDDGDSEETEPMEDEEVEPSGDMTVDDAGSRVSGDGFGGTGWV
ncbi:leucine-rich repeat extensin-like protein 3 [Salvia miltiorrhiza]|uniref:leucine-rich repeat extensin-like protein 3 n=1 Tax=Salvia miltiorrhiza TaxID=226208 RepID=UPI0025ACBBDD|nr:leucine-rich repeat extensin-like protein 3 [Salvia miltiorrhiza]